MGDPATSGREPFWADVIIFAKGLYEVVAMLLLSVTVLTLTGTLRERD